MLLKTSMMGLSFSDTKGISAPTSLGHPSNNSGHFPNKSGHSNNSIHH